MIFVFRMSILIVFLLLFFVNFNIYTLKIFVLVPLFFKRTIVISICVIFLTQIYGYISKKLVNGMYAKIMMEIKKIR